MVVVVKVSLGEVEQESVVGNGRMVAICLRRVAWIGFLPSRPTTFSEIFYLHPIHYHLHLCLRVLFIIIIIFLLF